MVFIHVYHSKGWLVDDYRDPALETNITTTVTGAAARDPLFEPDPKTTRSILWAVWDIHFLSPRSFSYYINGTRPGRFWEVGQKRWNKGLVRWAKFGREINVFVQFSLYEKVHCFRSGFLSLFLPRSSVFVLLPVGTMLPIINSTEIDLVPRPRFIVTERIGLEEILAGWTEFAQRHKRKRKNRGRSETTRNK